MPGPAFDKGLESLIAELLRVHLVDSVFARDAVRNGLPPERIEALRQEIVSRLKRAEDVGRDDRAAVRSVLDAALAVVPGGASVASLIQSLLANAATPRTEGTPSNAPAPGPAADAPGDPEGR